MFDLHVHAAPDVVPRKAADVELAQSCAARGYSGFVLKGHYESTVGRAAAAASASGLRVFGGIALNQHAGGINPAAVEAALRAGGRVVWFPTADARTQEAAGLPRLCDLGTGSPRHTYAVPPVEPATAEDATRICELVAEADAVLATGHLSTEEVGWLLPVARRAGVRRVLLTHPAYTVPSMPAVAARELAERGAMVELTAFQLLHQPGCTPEMLAGYAREVGAAHLVLSSDAGQPDSPDPPEALAMLVDRLAARGLDRGALLAAAGAHAERLVEH